MRRKGQYLSRELAEKLLSRASTGVLAVLGDDDYPYAVPLNFVYDEGKIFIHCARSGHKLDSMRRHAKVSFCIVDKEQVVPELFATDYRSVIAFGKANEVVDDKEKLHAMRLFTGKYSPELHEEGEKEIRKDWNILCVMRIDVEHMTGKEAMDSVRNHANS